MARGKWHRLRLGFEQLSQLLGRLNRGALPDINYFGSIATLLRLKRRQLDEESCRWWADTRPQRSRFGSRSAPTGVSQLIQQQFGLTRKESL